MMEFGEKVKFARKTLEMTQCEFAAVLEVSFASINRWENGRVEPSALAKKSFDEFCDSNFIKFDE